LLSSIILGWLFAMAIGQVLEAVFYRYDPDAPDVLDDELDG